MARINIDDELHAEKGFKRLVRALGDEDKAVGLLYRFWRSAQDYWGNECALMPLEEFELDGFRPILDAGLAELRPAGVYAKGAEERFVWYLQKCRASKAGVRARSANRNPEPDPPEPPRRSTGDDPPVNPTASVPVPVPVPATVTDISSVPAPAPARDTGPGPGDAYGQGGRDRGQPGLEPLDFEIPELIASEIEARARQLEAPPGLAVPADPAPPRPAPPPPPRRASPITPVSPARRVIPGPWPNTSRDTSRDTSPARRSDAPPGYRGPFALPMDGQEAGAEARAMFRSIWGERYSPPVPEPVREENTA